MGLRQSLFRDFRTTRVSPQGHNSARSTVTRAPTGCAFPIHSADGLAAYAHPLAHTFGAGLLADQAQDLGPRVHKDRRAVVYAVDRVTAVICELAIDSVRTQ